MLTPFSLCSLMLKSNAVTISCISDAGLNYHLERQNEPGFALDPEQTLNDVNCMEFAVVRDNSMYQIKINFSIHPSFYMYYSMSLLFFYHYSIIMMHWVIFIVLFITVHRTTFTSQGWNHVWKMMSYGLGKMKWIISTRHIPESWGSILCYFQAKELMHFWTPTVCQQSRQLCTAHIKSFGCSSLANVRLV